MLRRDVKLQLMAFALIAVVSLGYGMVRYGGLDDVLSPPDTVYGEFASSGGIYPEAQVTLLGVPVGEVNSLHPEPDGSVVVEMEIDRDARVPADATATIARQSVVGEQYVLLEPSESSSAQLSDGSVIPSSRTSVPLPVEELLANINRLMESVPERELATALDELADAFHGSGPDLERLLDRSQDLVDVGLDNLDDMIDLIHASSTVLDTQAELGPETTRVAEQLAGLTTEIRGLDSDLARLFTAGGRASEEISGLMRESGAVLPSLLDNLLTLTDTAAPRQQGIRKALVVFPHVVETAMSAVRYCDEYDPDTGEPVAETCHYDPRTGEPDWSAYFAMQIPSFPTDGDGVCIEGYEGTRKHLPSGEPVAGDGPQQHPDSPPNIDARCAAEPTDPLTPNVRGAQNAPGPDGRPRTPDGRDSAGVSGGVGAPLSSNPQRYAVDDKGKSRPVIDHIGSGVPSGANPLEWLMVRAFEEGENG